MKILLFIFLFSLGFIQVKAQQNKVLSDFYKIQDSAQYYEAIGNDEKALRCYLKLLTFKQFEIKNDAYQLISKIYLRQNKIDKATEYLIKFILKAGPIHKDWFDYNYNGKIKLNIDSLNNKFPLDYALFSQIHQNLWEDQTLRKIDFPLRTDTSFNQDVRNRMFKKYDSMNCDALKKIVETIGHIPSYKEIGWQLQSNFIYVLVRHHFAKDTTFWSGYLRAAINNGTISRIFLPYLIDENQMMNMAEKKPVYDVYYNFENPTQILEPLYPERIDQLRKEAYLPSLYMQALIEKTILPENYQYDK